MDNGSLIAHKLARHQVPNETQHHSWSMIHALKGLSSSKCVRFFMHRVSCSTGPLGKGQEKLDSRQHQKDGLTKVLACRNFIRCCRPSPALPVANTSASEIYALTPLSWPESSNLASLRAKRLIGGSDCGESAVCPNFRSTEHQILQGTWYASHALGEARWRPHRLADQVKHISHCSANL